jgi:hypothetical protein
MGNQGLKVKIIFLIFGLFLGACAAPQAPQQAPTGITPTVTPAPINTPEPSPTATTSWSDDWAGTWYVWVQNDIHPVPVEFSVAGNQLMGVVEQEGDARTVAAELLPGGISAVGSWSSDNERSGSLGMLISQDRQEFSGNMGGVSLFCGSRIGKMKPKACWAGIAPDWSGEWIAWLGPDEVELVLFFKVDGNAVEAVAYDVAGTLSEDGRTFTGTFNEFGIPNGSIEGRILDNLAQFTGNILGSLPFCGVRRGGPKPEVCLEP